MTGYFGRTDTTGPALSGEGATIERQSYNNCLSAMQLKRPASSLRNPFLKLGADIESNIVNALDITSSINYLLTSKRTAKQAEQKGWDFMILKFNERCELADQKLPYWRHFERLFSE